MAEELTDEEVQLLEELGLGSTPKSSDKNDAFTFFKYVLRLKNTIKTGNLTETELGVAEFPVRTSKWLALFSESMGNKGFAKLFDGEAEIITASSLSRKGFLPKLAVTTNKVTTVGSRGSGRRRGLFSRKEREDEGT